jgi:outer membrane protein OmpA-like peptidoglycan-associated protein
MRRLMLLGVLFAALGACSLFDPPGQRYLVFFQEWSASLDDGGQAAVTAAAGWANQHPDAPVTVIGFADPEGSPQANRDLSRTRAQVVADQLATDGVAPARITVRSAGSVDYTMDSQESRRVIITLGIQ